MQTSMRINIPNAVAVLLLAPLCALARGPAVPQAAAIMSPHSHSAPDTPASARSPAAPSEHGAHSHATSAPHSMHMSPFGLLGSYKSTRDASGTSWQPDASTHRGWHIMAGEWMVMAHAQASYIYDTQSGQRGDEKGFFAGMIMASARREFGADTLGFRAMLTPEPLMGRRGYPLLLATGETANGMTHLVDRQHPHDLFMELSGSFAHRFGEASAVFLYAGYPGEVALGPPAFMHRPSAEDNPQAPITHHWLDSTHVVFGVVSVGYVRRNWKLETSRFTGREPDQNRFGFDRARWDSSAVRLSWNPDAHWALQVSGGKIKSPEQLEPNVDETRFTASALYSADLSSNVSLVATLAWGVKQPSAGKNLNGVLGEATLHIGESWSVFTRAEWEENAEVDASGRIARVGEATIGALHDWRLATHARLGLGALYSADFVPGYVAPVYGSNPHGAMAFVRIKID